MRATNVIRFVVLGAVGFSLGGAIVGTMVGSAGISMISVVLLGPLAVGLGGASLGLALKDWRKAAVLALLSIVGFFFGIIVAGFVGLFIMLLEFGGPPEHAWASDLYAASGLQTAVIGAVGGAALGLAFKDRRSFLALALAGFVGFGVGGALVYGVIDVFSTGFTTLVCLSSSGEARWALSAGHRWERHSDTWKIVG